MFHVHCVKHDYADGFLYRSILSGGFETHLLDDPLEDFELLKVVPADLVSNRRAKTLFTELEVSSIYIYGII